MTAQLDDLCHCDDYLIGGGDIILASVDCSGLIRMDFSFQGRIIFEVSIECLLCFVAFEILTLYLASHLHNSIFSSLDVSPYQGLDSDYGE